VGLSLWLHILFCEVGERPCGLRDLN
jgi:hypothetical protein